MNNTTNPSSFTHQQITVLEERLAGAEPVAAALRRENATLKRLLDAYEATRAF